MELLHASKEPFYRYIPCNRCNSLSRNKIIFKHVFFDQKTSINAVCYTTCCLNCSQVYRKDIITKTHVATYEEWNIFLEKGIYPERKDLE